MTRSLETPSLVSESSKNVSQEHPTLPRSAWESKLMFFKALLKAKQALDRMEKERN